jgi:hypothetical protein
MFSQVYTFILGILFLIIVSSYTALDNGACNGADIFFLPKNGAVREKLSLNILLEWNNCGQLVKFFRISGCLKGIQLNDWATALSESREYSFSNGGNFGLIGERIETTEETIMGVRNNHLENAGSKLMTELNLLQVNFSDSVELELIQALHTSGLSDERASSIQELVDAAGGDKLSAVYELSAEEIAHDHYGFARTFKLYLKPDTEINQAIEILQRSPLIESVKPVGISKAFDR